MSYDSSQAERMERRGAERMRAGVIGHVEDLSELHIAEPLRLNLLELRAIDLGRRIAHHVDDGLWADRTRKRLSRSSVRDATRCELRRVDITSALRPASGSPDSIIISR